jgi:hypothetical protein
MNKRNRHEFLDFMKSVKDSMAYEYDRIQKRTTEDPGTAGDQAEENWATILRNWLPANYPVVTKGRIIDDKGNVSPQVDVLVLNPSYPLALRDKKLYFAGGVVAAFESKLTLRAGHISKAFQTAAMIKGMVPKREGTPYDELTQPIIFGILAHSSEHKTDAQQKRFLIMKQLHKYLLKTLDTLQLKSPDLCHPRYLMDVVCVADVATFTLAKEIFMGPTIDEEREELFGSDSIGGVSTSYEAQWEDDEDTYDSRGHLIAALICMLTVRLAYEDPSLQSFADYISSIGLVGGIGVVLPWSGSIFSDAVTEVILRDGYVDGAGWSRWNRHVLG